MTISRRKESHVTLETLTDEARFEKLTPSHNSSRRVIGMPHQDEGLQRFLSAIVCLFGSWVGSDKGAM